MTGKWDPGLLDLDIFRAGVARLINEEDDEMKPEDWERLDKKLDAAAERAADLAANRVLDEPINKHDPKGDPAFQGKSLREVIKDIARG